MSPTILNLQGIYLKQTNELLKRSNLLTVRNKAKTLDQHLWGSCASVPFRTPPPPLNPYLSRLSARCSIFSSRRAVIYVCASGHIKTWTERERFSFHSRPFPASLLFLLPSTAKQDLRSLRNSVHERGRQQKKVRKKNVCKNRIKKKQNNKQTVEVIAKQLKINRSVCAHLI